MLQRFFFALRSMQIHWNSCVLKHSSWRTIDVWWCRCNLINWPNEPLLCSTGVHKGDHERSFPHVSWMEADVSKIFNGISNFPKVYHSNECLSSYQRTRTCWYNLSLDSVWVACCKMEYTRYYNLTVSLLLLTIWIFDCPLNSSTTRQVHRGFVFFDCLLKFNHEIAIYSFNDSSRNTE